MIKKILLIVLFGSMLIFSCSAQQLSYIEKAYPELTGLTPATSFLKYKPKLIEIPSKSLRGVGKFMIYLPPDYYKNDRKYPVVYYLHGMGDNCSTWLEGEQEIAKAVTLMIEKGAIQPMILVVPEGERDLWLNFEDGSKLYEDWVVKDLRKYIEKHYRTINKKNFRAIMGVSMGGFGALNIGFHNPDVYEFIFALTPAFPDINQWSQGYFRKNHPIWIAKDSPEKLKSIKTFVKCGSIDGFFPVDSFFVSTMANEKLFCEFKVYPGMKHEALYFVKSSLDGLKQFSELFGK